VHTEHDRGLLRVTVEVQDEDPDVLLDTLVSVLRQTPPPDLVQVIDAGSRTADYTLVRTIFEAAAHKRGVHVEWVSARRARKDTKNRRRAPRVSTQPRDPDEVDVTRRRSATAITASIILGALLFWSILHVRLGSEIWHGQTTAFAGVYMITFGLVTVEMVLCCIERPYRVTRAQRAKLDRLHVVVNVPVYNEEPAALMRCLASMLRQSRPPQHVDVVDDGSTVDYADVRARFEAAAAEAGVSTRWTRQHNGGKRSAQGRTVVATPEADIYVTVDSDAELDRDAISEGLKPFIDPRVQSVAGVVLVRNRVNVLTWFTDLWFTVGQLVDRSSLSSVGGVLVNSGALALYRAGLLRDNLDGYLNETFFGRRVELSDDSLLTIYALSEGRAVQQPTAFALTLMPETLSHHRRQYLRWMRGAFIRSWWRFRYLPLRSWPYWMHFAGWMQMVFATITFGVFFVYTPVVQPSMIPLLLVVPFLVGYGQALRYFLVRRSDTVWWQQLAMFLVTPVLTVYSFFVLRALRYYAMATCLKVGWGTRAQVESLTTGAALEASTVAA
jgi:hyaluronan synthase